MIRALRWLLDLVDDLYEHPRRAVILSCVLGLAAAALGSLAGLHGGLITALVTFALGLPWAMRAGSPAATARQAERKREREDQPSV